MGKAWKISFPDVPNDKVRYFLVIFTEAFCIKPENKLKLEPKDNIYDIYRSFYPSDQQPDALELETLGKLLEKEYKIKLETIFSEQLSLGELFSYTSKP